MLIEAEWVLYVTQITSTLIFASAVMAIPWLAVGWWLVGRQPGDGAERFWRAAKVWIGVWAVATVALSATEAARDHQPVGLAIVLIVTAAGAVLWHRHAVAERGQGRLA